MFEQAESVDRALKDKPIMLYGSHRLNVEEKKMRTPRDPGQPFTDRDRQERGNRGSQESTAESGLGIGSLSSLTSENDLLFFHIGTWFFNITST